MQLTIDLPEDIAALLKGEWKDVPQRSLEAIAVEAYRTGALSENQVRRLLNFESRFQVHALLINGMGSSRAWVATTDE
jgi:hypothetical protein